jgi:hypothetical protein
MMQETIKKHLLYYAVFIGCEFMGLILLLFTAGEKNLQLLVVLSMTLFYIFWTIMHQYIHHRLTLKIVLEYVLIGSLGLVLSWFLFTL